MLSALTWALTGHSALCQTTDTTETIVPDPEDEDEADFIAKQILDSGVQIAVFEVPGFQTMPRTLKSGVLPELEEGYIDQTISKGIVKLNVMEPIRGVFDSMIYTKQPVFETDMDAPMQFWSYPETRWILFTRSSYNKEGRAKSDWVVYANKPMVEKYINPKTAFDVASFYKGCICLNWNKEFDRPENIVVKTERVAKDLHTIVTLVGKLPADPAQPAYAAQLSAIDAQLDTELGKSIGASVRRRLTK